MDYQLGPGPLQVDQNTTDEKIKGDIGIVENGDIATHAILKDYYVIWKGDLYKAKTDISSGTTLSAGSNGNLEPKSNGLGGEVAALSSKTIKKMNFIATTSANGNFPLGEIIDTSKYTVISVSAYKTDADSEMVVCIPYQYTKGRPGRINGVHCLSEFATYGVVANTTITGVLYYAEI